MQDHQEGILFVVGGAEDRTQDKLILRRFVEVAGGSEARLLVVATASRIPEQLLDEYGTAFRDLGVRDLHLCFQRQRAEAEDPELLNALRRATAVFITGGDQLRLTTILAGTAFSILLQERFRQGLHLAGTSAGASVLSTVMIARGRARAAPRLSSVRFAPGLGVLPGIIVDQHFQERDRFGRLMAAVLRHPGYLGFGIDEGTAFIVAPGRRIDVLGKGTLTIADGREIVGSDICDVREHEPLAFGGLQLHVLKTGWQYDLQTHRVHLPATELAGQLITDVGDDA